jgi:hypothetical protein
MFNMKTQKILDMADVFAAADLPNKPALDLLDAYYEAPRSEIRN